jgi:type IV pilus assembly protein PilA
MANRVPRQGGFTLLEIMFTLSIVSILAMVAVPTYLDYTVRARISEGFSLVEPVKGMVVEYYDITGTWPNSNQVAAVAPPASFKTDYVDSISIAKNAAGAAITITYSILALGANNTIVFTPSDIGGSMIAWSCKNGTVINKFRPPACRI